MKGITKIFFYYSLLTLTFLCLGSMVVLEPPFNMAYMLILLPTVLFSWLKFTDPTGATESEWSTRIFVVVVTLLVLSGFSYYLFINKPVDTSDTIDVDPALVATMSAEIKMLRDQIEQTKSQKQDEDASPSAVLSEQSINDLLKSLTNTNPTPSASPATGVTGEVKIISQNVTNIFESNDTSSRIIGVAEPGGVYDFKDKISRWYLIQFEEGRTGWIESKEVVEL